MFREDLANLLSRKTDELNNSKSECLFLEKKRSELQERLNQIESEIRKINQDVSILDQCVEIFRALIESVREDTLKRVSSLVTRALKEVFQQDLEFRIESRKSRGDIQFDFFVYDGRLGRNLHLFKSVGGGVRNVVSVILRIVFLLLCFPQEDVPILLDEVGGKISVEFRERFGEFLKTVSEELNRQIILVSHEKEIVSFGNQIFKLEKSGDKSFLGEVKKHASQGV